MRVCPPLVQVRSLPPIGRVGVESFPFRRSRRGVRVLFHCRFQPARHLEGPWDKYPHSLVFKPMGNIAEFDGVFPRHACPVLLNGQWSLCYNGRTLNREAKNSFKAEYAIGLAFAKE